MKPFLLFDFDGTIADSIRIGCRIVNRLAPGFGHEPFSEADFQRFRSIPLAAVLKELKIPWYRIPATISGALMEYRLLIHDLEPYDGIATMLRDLHKLGVSTALLSSNTKENLTYFLDRYQMTDFEWVEGTSGILKKHKQIWKQLKKHNLSPKQVLYVGDEVRDIVAAKKCGLRVIAVTWGFHTTELLSRHDPDFLVSNPQEIVEIARLQ